MPFNAFGCYVHDFHKLPIIWEDDEDDFYDDRYSSSVTTRTPASSEFRPTSSYTTASEYASTATSPTTCSSQNTSPTSELPPNLKRTAPTYKTWRPREEDADVRRQTVNEDSRPLMIGASDGELRGNSGSSRSRWRIFKKFSKSKGTSSKELDTGKDDAG
ncbi:uncharacterized protein AB675_6023 [Cyphellophora attinorum]|uniref:Uncharacterized protein n=1 Tax=Cyphellophora attinorum TaxID=1664694 RepID=A0A0N0NJQ6_9EURO|nr:uncharacterized protein AB675_6023 [Phialophora attinorum]KPI36929.1 hypothetical protein AB675_6023 [Phialophora attinorum]